MSDLFVFGVPAAAILFATVAYVVLWAIGKKSM